jgi:hypothetical protein
LIAAFTTGAAEGIFGVGALTAEHELHKARRLCQSICPVKVSKRAIAREWLIFLVLLPFGSIACYYFGYGWSPASLRGRTNIPMSWYRSSLPSFDEFWNEGLGLFSHNVWTISMWLLPYIAVTLLRSIFWSIKALRAKDR